MRYYTTERFVNGEQPSVELTFRRNGWDRAQTIVLPIDLYLAEKHFAPIDFPSEGADPETTMLFCTPNAERKLKERKEIIRLISLEVAKHLADVIGAKDTEMGYSKGRQW